MGWLACTNEGSTRRQEKSRRVTPHDPELRDVFLEAGNKVLHAISSRDRSIRNHYSRLQREKSKGISEGCGPVGLPLIRPDGEAVRAPRDKGAPQTEINFERERERGIRPEEL